MSVTERIKREVPLTTYTTLHVGGNAQFFLETKNRDEVREAVAWARQGMHTIVCIGGGSNILVSDEGVSGLVLRQIDDDVLIKEEDRYVRVRASAGVILDELVEKMVEKGIWGLENLSGIPGSVGATPIQNVGAYGVEVSDVIESVEVYDIDQDAFCTLSHGECEFGYRDSLFKREERKQYIIVAVTFSLSRIPRPQLNYKDLERYFKDETHPSLDAIRIAVLAIRSHKFPDWHSVGTAGSFFKNPIIGRDAFMKLRQKHVDIPGFEIGEDTVKIPFGYVLDKIFHLKGIRKGNVSLYAEQALVLISHRGATAHEIDTFASEIIFRAKQELGLIIEREVVTVQ